MEGSYTRGVLLYRYSYIVTRNLSMHRCIVAALFKLLHHVMFLFTKQFGSSQSFSLFKGSMGKFGDFLSRCEEDVVVLAHTHNWKEEEVRNTKNGDVFYLNTGTWVDFAHDVSTVKPGLCFNSS